MGGRGSSERAKNTDPDAQENDPPETDAKRISGGGIETAVSDDSGTGPQGAGGAAQGEGGEAQTDQRPRGTPGQPKAAKGEWDQPGCDRAPRRMSPARGLRRASRVSTDHTTTSQRLQGCWEQARGEHSQNREEGGPMQALVVVETTAESAELIAALRELGWRVHRVEGASLARTTTGTTTTEADGEPALLERVAKGGYELVWVQWPQGAESAIEQLTAVREQGDWAKLLQAWALDEGGDTAASACAKVTLAAPTSTVTTVIEGWGHQGGRRGLPGGGAREQRRRSSEQARAADENAVSGWIEALTVHEVQRREGASYAETTLTSVGPGRSWLQTLAKWCHHSASDIRTSERHDTRSRGNDSRRLWRAVAFAITGGDPVLQSVERSHASAADARTSVRAESQEDENRKAAAKLWDELTGAGEPGREEGSVDSSTEGREPHEEADVEACCHNKRRLRSAPGRIPASWPEAVDIQSTHVDQARSHALKYISRRRSVAERAEVLFQRQMPKTDERPRTSAQHKQARVEWPVGAPPRPIRIDQLFFDGAYARLQAAIGRVRMDMSKAEEEWRERRQHAAIPMRTPEVFTQEEMQPEWARGCIWDTRDPDDCVPLQSYTEQDPPEQEVNTAFFREWGDRLEWPDEDMLHQICIEGCASRSSCTRASVVFAHHTGLREHYGPARDAVHSDTKSGWVTEGGVHPPTIPVRLVPKNVVGQTKWKMADDGSLQQTRKWRVTTDDSMEAPGASSRNDGIDRATISNLELPTITQLAEAVAIMRATTADMWAEWREEELQHISMWALDLSDAYRRIAAARQEWWMQCFVWHDGVRLDKRCVFGSAHLVDFFQRVSTFVLAVAKRRIQEYEDTREYGEARREWVRRRQQAGNGGECFFAGIYLDDGFGASCEDSEHAQAGGCTVAARVRATGGGAELSLRIQRPRAAAHLAIVQRTFEEAGWRIATHKLQHGPTLDLLGLSITARGAGSLFIPETKRRGLLADISSQRRAKGDTAAVPRQEVEKLVGRLSHVSIVVAEGNAYLQPMYRQSCATARYLVTRRLPDGSVVQAVRRSKPRRLMVGGKSKTATAYQHALDWWQSALSKEVSTPLAPMLRFPELGGPRSAFVFTDAAREEGTGFGGFTMWENAGRSEFWFIAEQWSASMLRALQQNEVSMPAGEAMGAVILLDAVLSRCSEVEFVYCFTDSDATAKALTAAGSGAPQINFLIQWLLDRHRSVQFLGIHQRGVRNVASDRLSRGDARGVVAEAAASGARVVRLDPPPCFTAVTESVMTLPLRRED